MEEKEKTGGRFANSYSGGSSSRNPDTRNAFQRWVATLAQHEPYVTSEMVKRMLENFKCKSYAFQLEEGTLLGKRHFQMRFTLEDRTTKSRLLSQAQMSFRIWTGLGTVDAANWISDLTISQERGTPEDSKAYCTKPEGRVEGPYVYPYEYSGEDLLRIGGHRQRMDGLLAWTEDLMDIWANDDFGPSTPTNDRSIYWIFDPKGGTGKSAFMKSLAYSFKKDVRCIVPLYFSFPALLASLTSETGKRLYIMNFPRSFRPEPAHYSLMEQLKDGYLSSYMYGEMRDAFFRRPVVAVFSNELPDTWLLSHDRWKIFRIDWMEGKDGALGANRLAPVFTSPSLNLVSQMQGVPEFRNNQTNAGPPPSTYGATPATLRKRK